MQGRKGRPLSPGLPQPPAWPGQSFAEGVRSGPGTLGLLRQHLLCSVALPEVTQPPHAPSLGPLALRPPQGPGRL